MNCKSVIGLYRVRFSSTVMEKTVDFFSFEAKDYFLFCLQTQEINSFLSNHDEFIHILIPLFCIDIVWNIRKTTFLFIIPQSVVHTRRT